MSNLYDGSYRPPDRSEFLISLQSLKQIDFELAYLVLLTFEGFKPLSRWEKSLDEKALIPIREIGLLTRQIRRTVQAGNDVIETIFSRTPAYIHLYEESFGNRAIDKSEHTQRLEGFLFGYPPCCVEKYIRKPYAANGLTEQDQEILFHWACTNCKVTPMLLHSYSSIHHWLVNF